MTQRCRDTEERRFRFFSAALCLCVIVFGGALPAPAQDFTAVEQTAREEIARLKIPGAAIAVVKGDRVVFAKGFGVANIETGEAMRPEMVFRLGSTTKMFTAAALCGLAAEGKIDLDAPIGKVLPWLPPRLAAITANQLLSHTAGVLDSTPMYGPHDDDALGKGIRSWTDGWLFTAPGKIFSYSNPGYWLAGYLVETLTGKPYADAMDARLFKPLGMERTTFRPLLAMTWPLAQGHDTLAGVPRIARPAADNAASWPAGSMFSNMNDLARFVIAFLNDGAVDGKRVLDPKVIAMLSTPHAPFPDGSGSYGYGLMLSERRGVRMVEHGGSRTGYGSGIQMAPEQRVGIIMITNRSGAGLPATMEKAAELILPLREKSAPAKRESLPVTADDVAMLAGVYRNGEDKVEIVERGGKAVLLRGIAELPMVKRGAMRFGPESGPGEYLAVRGGDGKAEYLVGGLRAYARVK